MIILILFFNPYYKLIFQQSLDSEFKQLLINYYLYLQNMTKRIAIQTPPSLTKVRKNSISPWDSDDIPQIQSPLKKYLKSQKKQAQKQTLRINPENKETSKQTVKNFLPRVEKRPKFRQSISINIQQCEKEDLCDRNQISMNQDVTDQMQILKSQLKIESAPLNTERIQSKPSLEQKIQKMTLSFNQVNTLSRQFMSLSSRKPAENSPLQTVRKLISEFQHKKCSNISIFTLPMAIFNQDQGFKTPVLCQSRQKFVKRSWKNRSRTIYKA